MREEILLDQLTNEELFEIFEQQPISAKIIELIQIEEKKARASITTGACVWNILAKKNEANKLHN